MFNSQQYIHSCRAKARCVQWSLTYLVYPVLFFLSYTAAAQSDNTRQCTSGMLSAGDFQTVTEIHYLETFSSQQILVPQMKFNCHGYITKWHAQLINNVSSPLGHAMMHFHVWRPSTYSNGLYSLVGSNAFEIGPQNSTTRIQNSMMEYFSFSKQPNRQIFFQPGDILGFFFSSSSPHGRSPTVGVMFRNSSNQEDPTTMIMKHTNTEPCEISDGAGDVQHLPSAVPYISVDYGKIHTLTL